MGRSISSVAETAIVDIKNYRCNQAQGYSNIASLSQATWYGGGSFGYANQFADGNQYLVLSNKDNYIKLTGQITADHGDTWRSGLFSYGLYDSANGISGNITFLASVGSTSYISGSSASNSASFSQTIFRPLDYISGLADGDRVYFAYRFRLQSAGDWQYVNNLQVNSESANNGAYSKGGLAFYAEEIPANLAGADWDP